MRVNHIKLRSADDLPDLHRQRRVIERELAQVGAGGHAPVDALVEDAMDRKIQRLGVVGDVIGNELNVMTTSDQRFREALDAERSAAARGHGAGRDHRYPIAWHVLLELSHGHATGRYGGREYRPDYSHRLRSASRCPGAAPKNRIFSRSAATGAPGATTDTRSTAARATFQL